MTDDNLVLANIVQQHEIFIPERHSTNRMMELCSDKKISLPAEMNTISVTQDILLLCSDKEISLPERHPIVNV